MERWGDDVYDVGIREHSMIGKTSFAWVYQEVGVNIAVDVWVGIEGSEE